MYLANFDFRGDFVARCAESGWVSFVGRFDDTFTASASVLIVVLNTSVASTSRSWGDNRGPSNVVVVVVVVVVVSFVVDFAPRDVVFLARLAAVLLVFRDVSFVLISVDCFEVPRRKV